MANIITKLNIGNTPYDLIDTRIDDTFTVLKWIGITTTELVDGSTTASLAGAGLLRTSGFKTGDLVIYNTTINGTASSREFINISGTWRELGTTATLGKLAFKNSVLGSLQHSTIDHTHNVSGTHTHSFQSGTVTVAGNITPAGDIVISGVNNKMTIKVSGTITGSPTKNVSYIDSTVNTMSVNKRDITLNSTGTSINGSNSASNFTINNPAGNKVLVNDDTAHIDYYNYTYTAPNPTTTKFSASLSYTNHYTTGTFTKFTAAPTWTITSGSLSSFSQSVSGTCLDLSFTAGNDSKITATNTTIDNNTVVITGQDGQPDITLSTGSTGLSVVNNVSNPTCTPTLTSGKVTLTTTGTVVKRQTTSTVYGTAAAQSWKLTGATLTTGYIPAQTYSITGNTATVVKGATFTLSGSNTTIDVNFVGATKAFSATTTVTGSISSNNYFNSTKTNNDGASALPTVTSD